MPEGNVRIRQGFLGGWAPETCLLQGTERVWGWGCMCITICVGHGEGPCSGTGDTERAAGTPGMVGVFDGFE